MTNSVRISHIEIVQSVQNAINETYTETVQDPECTGSGSVDGIPLITYKPTYARVYLEDVSVSRDFTVSGKLRVHYTNSDGHRLTVNLVSENSILLRRQGNPSLMEQRLDWYQSLNFRIPEYAIAVPESKTFEFISLAVRGKGKVRNSKQAIHAEFVPKQNLVVRALSIRYRDAEKDTFLEPSREEIDAIRDFVERCYPVVKIDWSVIRVEANRDFLPLDQVQRYEREDDEASTKMLANLLRQIMTFRNQDLLTNESTEADPPVLHRKTLYIGILSDPRGRFGGVAHDSPDFPVTHAVAACATDINGNTAAHELAHILGRHHPGVPDLRVHGRSIGQFRVDDVAPLAMGKRGRLSNKTTAEEIHLGLDIASSTRRHHVPRVLDHRSNFDLMTYRWPQWLSAYNYREIYHRLKCINATSYNCPDDVKCWTVICSYDLERKDGQILHVLPTNYLTRQFPQEYETVNEFLAIKNVKYLLWLNTQGVFEAYMDLWKIIQAFLGGYTDNYPFFRDRSKKSEKENPRSERFDVNAYNSLINTLQANGGEEFLQKYNVVLELDEPEIRLYTNHTEFDGVCPGDLSNPCEDKPEHQLCPEESLKYMWDEAEEMNYRRAGGVDRFPFGLFQATVKSLPNSTKPPKSISLLIDGVLVDKFAQPPLAISTPIPLSSLPEDQPVNESEQVAAVLFDVVRDAFGPGQQDEAAGDDAEADDIVENGQAFDTGVGESDPCEPRPPVNSLVYDIRKDAYFLNFHWPMSVVDCGRPWDYDTTPTITTTIQCRRGGCRYPYTLRDVWETVCVTDELNGQVWISPDLFETSVSGADCNPRQSAKRPYRQLRDREQDSLRFRFILTIGFSNYFSEQFTVRPILVKPKRRSSFRKISSDERCYEICSYDDGYDSNLDQSVG